MILLSLHTPMSISSTSHHALSFHYVLHHSLLTTASDTILASARPLKQCGDLTTTRPRVSQKSPYFVLVCFDADILQPYDANSNIRGLIEATCAAFNATDANIKVVMGDGPLDLGVVVVPIDSPEYLELTPQNLELLIEQAQCIVQRWIYNFRVHQEVSLGTKLLI